MTVWHSDCCRVSRLSVCLIYILPPSVVVKFLVVFLNSIFFVICCFLIYFYYTFATQRFGELCFCMVLLCIHLHSSIPFLSLCTVAPEIFCLFLINIILPLQKKSSPFLSSEPPFTVTTSLILERKKIYIIFGPPTLLQSPLFYCTFSYQALLWSLLYLIFLLFATLT